MLQLLSLAIGVSFVYLLVSLVVSALNELVLSALDQRAKFLKEGLSQLLGNHEPTTVRFLEHGLIDAFSRSKNGAPSYIPSNAFVTVLLDLIVPARPNGSEPTSVRAAADIAKALAETAGTAITQTNPKLAESLRALFDDAQGDLQMFRNGLERWFNQSTDRVSGWYKRRVQQVLFCLAFAIAIAGNIDSLRIIQGLSTDPKMLDSVVQAAGDSVKEHANAGSLPTSTEVGILVAQVKDAATQLNSFALPIGWNDTSYNYLFHDVGHGPQIDRLGLGWNWSHLLTALAGWLLTALAASLGAPFWFDTLQKFITIRGAGRSPRRGGQSCGGKGCGRCASSGPGSCGSYPRR